MHPFALFVLAFGTYAAYKIGKEVWKDHHKKGKREATYNGTKLVLNYDLPQIQAIQTQYENSKMIVTMEFDRPFNGIIFSERHSADPHCAYLAPGSALSKVTFDIDVNVCGMTSYEKFNNGSYGNPTAKFIESSIKIQYNPMVENIWDQSATFQVDMIPFIMGNYNGDTILGCWMQIQVGKGPLASEMSGMVGIGQTMTMVL